MHTDAAACIYYDALSFWSDDFDLHEASFTGDEAKLESLIEQYKQEGSLRQRIEHASRDKHGLTPLMVATMKQHLGIVKSLMTVGADPRVKVRSWRAYHIAIEVGNQELARMLLAREVEMEKEESKRQKERVLDRLADMPDVSFSLSWEIGSSFPGLGLLIRSLAPSDTYHITKQGGCTRVDGSMMGLDKKAMQKKQSYLPHWKKGSFSLLHTSASSPSLVLIDRLKERWIDVNAWRKKAGTKANSEIIQKHVEESFESRSSDGRVVKSKIKTPDVKFQPLTSGWLSSQTLREKVNAWESCQVLESCIVLSKEVKTKAKYLIVDTWQSYLNLDSLIEEGHEDEVILQPLDPLSKTATKGRSVSAKMWMSPSFPLSLKQLLPLLEVIGSANESFKKVASWMSRFSSEGFFPVKIIIPLAFTVYIKIQIGSFTLNKNHASPNDFFSIPNAFKKHEPKIPESFLGRKSKHADQEMDFEI